MKLMFYEYRPPTRKKPKSSTSDDIEVEILKELRKGQSLDEDELFGQSVGATLKKMTDQQKALAKMKIQQVMYEIQYCPVQPTSFYAGSDSSIY